MRVPVLVLVLGLTLLVAGCRIGELFGPADPPKAKVLPRAKECFVIIRWTQQQDSTTTTYKVQIPCPTRRP